jgi:hypothetical protein
VLLTQILALARHQAIGEAIGEGVAEEDAEAAGMPVRREVGAKTEAF